MLRYAKFNSQWLARIDKNSVLTEDEWLKHVEAEYGVSGVELVETDDDTDPRKGIILMPPPGPPPPKTVDDILLEDLENAATILQLKTALIKRFGG